MIDKHATLFAAQNGAQTPLRTLSDDERDEILEWIAAGGFDDVARICARYLASTREAQDRSRVGASA